MGGYVPINDCDQGGLATIDLDGTWHMQGSATSWTLTNGSNMMSSTTPVDTTVTIQRMGCSTSMAVGSGSAADFATSVTPTALTYDCYHSGIDCRLGEVSWSICVANGVLRYRRDERQQHLEMQWGGTEVDTLMR